MPWNLVRNPWVSWSFDLLKISNFSLSLSLYIYIYIYIYIDR